MFVDWDKAAPVHGIRAGAVRKCVTGQLVSLVRVDSDPSAEFDGRPHRHVHEQWIVVVAGRLSVTCDGERSDLGTGDVVYVPSGTWHAAVGTGPEGASYLEFSAPPRMDLLPASIVPSAMEFPPDNGEPHR